MRKILKKYHNFILTDPEYFLTKNPKIFKLIFKLLSIAEIVVSKILPFIVSKKLAYFLGNMKVLENQIVTSQNYFMKAQDHEFTKIPAMLKIVSHLYMTNNLEYESFIKSQFNSGKMQYRLIDALLGWAWWETSHENFTNLLNKKLDLLNKTQIGKAYEVRFLPHHTSHLGHIGYLKKYIDYYAKVDAKRIVGIWPDVAPNSYYLEKIITSSNLKIQKFEGAPNKFFEDVQQIDNTMHSRLSEGNWRIEFGSGSFSAQMFPELSDDFLKPLEITNEENLRAEYYLEKNNISKSKWFVVLHIREVLKGSQVSIRAEDSRVENYRDFCNSVNELGGQVVRMGNRNFPKLASDFPAIDYAYSEFKSDFFDTWLWASCRWWTGNFNGASLPPLTFGVPRLITDAWPWDLNGPSSDVILPKLMLKENLNKTLTISETLQNKLSRNTNKEIFYTNGFKLRNNSPLELKFASEYMYTKTQSPKIKSQISRIVQGNLAVELNVPCNSTQMSIPSFFQPTYFYDLK